MLLQSQATLGFVPLQLYDFSWTTAYARLILGHYSPSWMPGMGAAILQSLSCRGTQITSPSSGLSWISIEGHIILTDFFTPM